MKWNGMEQSALHFITPCSVTYVQMYANWATIVQCISYCCAQFNFLNSDLAYQKECYFNILPLTLC